MVRRPPSLASCLVQTFAIVEHRSDTRSLRSSPVDLHHLLPPLCSFNSTMHPGQLRSTSLVWLRSRLSAPTWLAKRTPLWPLRWQGEETRGKSCPCPKRNTVLIGCAPGTRCTTDIPLHRPSSHGDITDRKQVHKEMDSYMVRRHLRTDRPYHWAWLAPFA